MPNRSARRATARHTKARDTRSGPSDATRVIDWLLEEEQPAVRYHALVHLLDRTEEDPEVREARAQIGRVGWAAEQLREQGPKGFWERRDPRNVAEWTNFLWAPMYRSTIWRALVLADLGLDRTDPRVRKIAELMFNFKLRLSSPFNFYYEEMCMSANTARMLTRFGYGDDPRVRKLYDWLVEDQREDGGWNCSQGTPGTLDVWEPLAAFASVPSAERPAAMTRAIERGAGFYLDRKLFEEGRKYAPWFRFHYPNHYYYDLLVGLDVITQLGFAGDRRLAPALEILRQKRRSDGTWAMGRTHPDIGRGAGYEPDRKKIHPLVIEPPGRPSKWITLRALRVLKKAGEAS